jgi:DNA-directed RNA polymerase specialized sigma24 family protein
MVIGPFGHLRSPGRLRRGGGVNALRVFDDEWIELAPRLSLVLAAKGVRAQDRDDLVQETALRLYRVWETLAPDQPVWPFAVTIALNLWRDQVRAAAVRQRDVLAANLADAVPEPATASDVERTVIARHELADVGAVIRRLAPEQRRLLLENDEVAAVVAPLRPAERMARMRARRELARLVGRASAALALLLWRRPLRATTMTTAACAGIFAATVMTSTPFVAPEPGLTFAAPHPGPALVMAGHTQLRPAAVPARRNGAAAAHAVEAGTAARDPGIASVPPADVCPPPESNRQRQGLPVVSVTSGGIYDGDQSHPVVETPPMSTDTAGCVHVG